MDKLRHARLLALCGYFGLLLLLPLWYGWLSPSQLSLGLVLGVLLLPLLFPLRGLLQGRPYTYAWSSFLALIYLIHAVVELYSSPQDRYLALLELLLSLAFYIGCVLYARAGGRELKRRRAD
ncbi:MAG: DUF2069 domain-containing protein [Gammaproteobacteria bacterium]|nr:DUF2069 domain-containing protein [Gammaproteobacteria bacterium]